MINRKIIKAIYLGILIILTNCGFSPIYTGDIKPITLFKLEISGDKNLSFVLERKLNFINYVKLFDQPQILYNIKKHT